MEKICKEKGYFSVPVIKHSARFKLFDFLNYVEESKVTGKDGSVTTYFFFKADVYVADGIRYPPGKYLVQLPVKAAVYQLKVFLENKELIGQKNLDLFMEKLSNHEYRWTLLTSASEHHATSELSYYKDSTEKGKEHIKEDSKEVSTEDITEEDIL